MGKRGVLFITLIIIIAGTIFVIDQMKHTTYEEVISDMIGQEEIVTSIRVEDVRDNIRILVVSEDAIEEILRGFSRMELKKQDSPPSVKYWMDIYTDTYRYEIMLGENDAQIGNAHYKIISENKLYQRIEQLFDDHTPIGYRN